MLLLGALSILAGVGASTASAATAFPKVGEIAGPGTGRFGLLKSESVAVNDVNGHVYVADSSNGTVYEFESPTDTTGEVFSGGAFGTGAVAVAVDESSGDVYVGDSTDKVIEEFTSAGTPIRTIDGSTTPAKTFEPPANFESSGSFGIAVDQASGDLYAIDWGHEVIDVFDQTGKYLRQITATPTGLYFPVCDRTDGIASDDASGELLVSNPCVEHGEESAKVFRFSLAGSYLGELSGTATPAGGFFGNVSVAAANESGRIYVLDTQGHVVDAFEADGTYSGSQIVGTPTGFEHGAVAVDQADGYVYVADGGTGTVAIFSSVIVPDVATLAATDVELESATLNGTVNPDSEGQATCQFRWGTTRSLEHTIPCEPETVAEGSAAVPVHAKLKGLEPGITYFFRLEATNKNGTNPGATDETHEFTTGGPHIYGEAVSGISSSSATLEAQIDPNGLPTTYRFEYLTEAQFNANGDSFAGASVLPASEGTVPSTPLGTALGTLVAGSDKVRELGIVSGSLPVGAVLAGEGIQPGTIVSSDRANGGSHIVAGQTSPYLSVPPTRSGSQLPITAPPSVSVSLTGLLPETRYDYRVAAASSTTPPAGIAGAPQVLLTAPASLEAALPDDRADELVSPSIKTAGGGVSASIQQRGFLATEDGSAITYLGEGFFEPPNPDYPQSYTSFRGPDGWSTRNTTGEDLEEAFAPHTPPPIPPAPVLPSSAGPQAKVLEQSADGSVVFFTDTADLTPGADASPGEPDLYRYQVAGESLTDLTVDPHPGEHADVQGVVAVGGEGAESGSYVYFVADGILAPGASAGDCSPEDSEIAGQEQTQADGTTPGTVCDLYLNHDGETSLLATLTAEDNSGRPLLEGRQTGLEARDWAEESGFRSAEASPGGRYLAFLAFEPLTSQPAPAIGPEVYRYDSISRTLVCASCQTNGSQSPGAFLTHHGEGDRRPHAVAENGRVFFNDLGALSGRDGNSTSDVYEFEDSGTGTCRAAEGCHFLISAGAGPGDSYFATASAEGDDVFFTSDQELTSEDGDASLDVYDARVGGRTPPVPVAPCETGEACHAAAPRPPVEPASPSSGFNGPEEGPKHPAGACKKGFVKKHGKCVKKHKAKRHHNKGHKRHAKSNRGASK